MVIDGGVEVGGAVDVGVWVLHIMSIDILYYPQKCETDCFRQFVRAS